jgi:hypothetical protein
VYDEVIKILDTTRRTAVIGPRDGKAIGAETIHIGLLEDDNDNKNDSE